MVFPIRTNPSMATEEVGALQVVNVLVVALLPEEMAVLAITVILVIHGMATEGNGGRNKVPLEK